MRLDDRYLNGWLGALQAGHNGRHEMNREEIIKLVHTVLDEQYENEKESIAQIRREMEEALATYKESIKQKHELKELVQQHATGVQNVYAVCREIKETFNIAKLDSDLFDKIERIVEIVRD